MSTQVEVDTSVLSDLEFEIPCGIRWYLKTVKLPDCPNPSAWQVDYISHSSDHEHGTEFCCDECLLKLRAWANRSVCAECSSFGFFKNVVRIK